MGRPVVLGLCALAVAACGRFGFGSGGDDDASVRVDVAPTDAFVDPNGPHQFEIGAFSTTSTTFVDIPGTTLTIPPSVGTRWLLLTSATLSSTTVLDVNVEARYLVDGVEQGIGGTQSSTPNHPGPWQHFYVIDGTALTQTITYQLRDNSGGTATIDQLRAVAVPLPALADVRYMSADPIQQTNSKPLNALAMLTLGSMAGEYIVFVLVNASDVPGLSDIYVEWRGPANETLMPLAQQPREPWQSFFMVSRLSINSANATFTLMGHVGGMTSQFRYVRVLAVRASAFPSLDGQTTTTPITTTTSSLSVANEVLPAASAASAYLYVMSSWAEEDCLNVNDAIRGLHFFVDTTDRPIFHAIDNCALQTTYGTAGLLSTRPSRLATAVTSENGESVTLRDSAILLLGLP